MITGIKLAVTYPRMAMKLGNTSPRLANKLIRLIATAARAKIKIGALRISARLMANSAAYPKEIKAKPIAKIQNACMTINKSKLVWHWIRKIGKTAGNVAVAGMDTKQFFDPVSVSTDPKNAPAANRNINGRMDNTAQSLIPDRLEKTAKLWNPVQKNRPRNIG